MKAIDLNGANVAITGAARGIGLATAQAFADKGATVWIGDLDGDAAAAAAAPLGGHGFAVDVRSKQSYADFLAHVAKSLGRMQDAIAIDEYIISRDPLQSIAFSQAGIAYQQGGMLDKSISTSRTALDMEPGQPVTRFIVGSSLLLQGRGEPALAEMRKEPFEPFRLFGLAMAYHALGDKAKSDAALAETVDKYGKDAAYNIAYVHAWRGESDQAFAWLDKAIEYQDTGLPMIAVEPLFDRLHSDPRWLPLLRRLGRAPEQLAAIDFKVDLPDAPPPPKVATAMPAPSGGTP